MTRAPSSLDDVVREVEARGVRLTRRRMLIAIAGAPGSGKSTFADALAAAITRKTARTAEVLSQDGFHFDNSILVREGRLDKKGALETFDVVGLRHVLAGLRDGTGDVAFPVFDRENDVVRLEAKVVSGAVDTIVVEGNYLLLDERHWRDLRPLFDLTIMLTCTIETLRSRLTERWIAHGLTPTEAAARAEGNDLYNARVVAERSSPADLVVSND